MSSPASFRLWMSALCNDGSLQTELVGSPQYHRVSENPCQAETERPELNENWMARMTGRIELMANAQLMTTRNRALPHGSVFPIRDRPEPNAGPDRTPLRWRSRRNLLLGLGDGD